MNSRLLKDHHWRVHKRRLNEMNEEEQQQQPDFQEEASGFSQTN